MVGPEHEATGLHDRAQLSVKQGPIWPGGLVEVALLLSGSELAIEVDDPDTLGLTQRGTVKRLFGAEALAGLGEGRRPRLSFEVSAAGFDFSNAPGRRGTIVVDLPGKPRFAINFLDFSPVEDATASPIPTTILRRTAEVLAGAGDAHQRREAWKAELEGAGARVE